jgi:5-formaminoimidazole-4-carboxamide-1-(beta)-D-ribofuranosyl 5'-monophosphate synthetase
MIEPSEMHEIFEEYDKDNLTIATIGSHSALQILKGGRELGFNTLAICKKGREVIYERFGVADHIIVVKDYLELLRDEIINELRKRNSIIVPHGSLIAYVGVDAIENRLPVPLFGNRKILRWESDRNLERQWLSKANIKMPKETKDPREISCLSIVKFPGAKGGRGYFLVQNYGEFLRKSREMLKKKRITKEDLDNVTIQEYVMGANMYLSYFYSPLNDTVELFGIDRRWEANIDGLTRIPAIDQSNVYIEPSYVVVGNAPVVARESLLAKIFRMGDDIVAVSKEIAPPGMLGPFCLETMVTHHLEFFAFEISARIVAGTNPFMNGSPYSYVQYGCNMSMGKRIALELRNALKEKKEHLLIT